MQKWRSMTYRERLANGVVRVLASILLRLDVKGLESVPRKGPGIILSNHTTNMEGPLYWVLLKPRDATALAKRELWDNPFTRFFMRAWDLIPLSRSGFDRSALAAAFQALRSGRFLGVAPEGTRSKTGSLGRAHAGAALLAERTGSPVYPIVHWGLRELAYNIRRGRRTCVSIRVGRPFRIHLTRRPTPIERSRIADEMMYQLAALLPPRLRGIYADRSRRTSEYLEFYG
jgi:1-acyl-sn-glycerol-3-phosphate acyltransferase